MAVPTIQGTSLRTGFSASRSPGTGTITGYTPVTGDIIGVWLRAGTVATITVPATWVNPLGGNTVVASAAHTEAMVYHVVTSAEATAVTTSWTLTNIWDSTQTGATYTSVIRGVDQVTIIDDVGTATGSATTTHVMAALVGANLLTDSLVLSGVVNDGTTTYSTAPTGWTFQCKNAGGQNGGALLSKDAATVAGVDISAENITASSSARYNSITAAFTAAGAAPANTTAFFPFL